MDRELGNEWEKFNCILFARQPPFSNSVEVLLW